MIQRIPKINIPATIAVCATFAASSLLVHFLRPASVVRPLCNRPATLTVKSGPAPALIPQGMIRYQSDAPIKFVATETGTCFFISLAHSECFYLIAKNVSGRRITGYALTYGYKDSTGRGITWSYVTSTDTPPSLDVNASCSFDVDSGDNGKEVWVDFVEFSDGTIWGPNITGTLGTMNAARIGTRQAALYYSWVLRTGGPAAMLESLEERITNSQMDQYDEHWKNGFNSGVESVRSHLLSDKYDIEAQMRTRSGEAYNAVLADRFRQTLQSYINFRHQ